MTRAADLFDWAASRSRNWCVSAEVSRNSFVRPLVSHYLSLIGERWLLVLVEGLSAAEVAQTLELSVDAVKSRLHRARKSLRERLAPWFEQSAPGPACPDVVELLSRYQEGDVTSVAIAQLVRER